MTSEEVEVISNTAITLSIHLENTRISKEEGQGQTRYDLLQASVEEGTVLDSIRVGDRGTMRVLRGDHLHELTQICQCLPDAQESVASPIQQEYLENLKAALQTGNMETYKDALRAWVQDLHPSVETTLGFMEPYRDPYGVRAEFEGLVGILQKEETKLLSKLVEHADRFISSLPWVGISEDNDGKGPFELAKMGYRDFSSVYSELGNHFDCKWWTNSRLKRWHTAVPLSFQGSIYRMYSHTFPVCKLGGGSLILR